VTCDRAVVNVIGYGLKFSVWFPAEADQDQILDLNFVSAATRLSGKGFMRLERETRHSPAFLFQA